MIKDGKKLGEVVCRVEKVKKIDVPFASEILDVLTDRKPLYTNIMDFFRTFNNKLWRSLKELEEQNYVRFQFLDDGRLEIEKLIN